MVTRQKKQVRNTSHELEVLESKVRMDGVGEDPVIQDLLSDKFVKGTDLQAGTIALALAELITGVKANSEQNNIIMKRLDKLQAAQDAWENDRVKFLEDVNKQSESLLVKTETEKDKIKALWSKTAQEARIIAQAEMATSQLEFDRLLETQPMETITSSGVLEMHREGETMVPYLVPEVIAIKNKKWKLAPGQACVVPKIVADEWRSRQTQNQILKERQNLMKDGKIESSELVREWDKINTKYKMGGESMPSPV